MPSWLTPRNHLQDKSLRKMSVFHTGSWCHESGSASRLWRQAGFAGRGNSKETQEFKVQVLRGLVDAGCMHVPLAAKGSNVYPKPPALKPPQPSSCLGRLEQDIGMPISIPGSKLVTKRP